MYPFCYCHVQYWKETSLCADYVGYDKSSPINNDFKFHYRWAELETFAPDLHPERRFAPLVRG